MDHIPGHTALITGAGVRIGKAIASRLAQEGVQIGIHCSGHSAEAERLAEAIRNVSQKATVVRADLSIMPLNAKSLFDALESELGSVEILINCAAIFEPSTLRDLSYDGWQRHFAINLQAPTFLAQEFVRRLPSDRRGHIINIVDWRGLRPVPGHLAYTLTKSALVSLTQILAQELGPRIQVNAIAPGAILPAPGQSDEDFTRLATAKNPLQRPGSPDDIADAVVFLLKSDFITGEILRVSGGEGL